MKLYRPIFFIFQSITIGLAIAFLIVVWKPGLLDDGKKIVAFIENPPATRAPQSPGPVSYADAVADAAPAVVNIYTSKTVTTHNPLLEDPLFRHFFGEFFRDTPRSRQETSLGSGVIVSQQGYILTNNHVVAEADGIEVALHDGRTTRGKLVGTDPETDLAVIKIELSSLPIITLGNSDQLRVGDVVLAIGNPFGVGQTVTQGIVSATGRSQLGLSTFENFIQTDAAINPGNSGGALISAGGELIGINTAIFSRSGGSQGIGFAIPVNLARGVMPQIIEHGHVSRGWMGVEIQELTAELAESFGLGKQQGIIIAGVLKQGPADRAGLRPGDIITEIHGHPLHDARTALNIITQTKPGQRINIKGLRNQEPFELEAVVSERPVQNTE
ncbi:MAG: Do family serine endopeptidase [Thiohalomonadaceae bacterium]